MKNNGGIDNSINLSSPLPLYYNPNAGSTEQVLEKIRDDERIRMEPLTPEKMKEVLKRDVLHGTKRVLVSGGDGTIALAVTQLFGTTTELAVIPGGTLNHFAQRVGLPKNTSEALDVALHGSAVPVDVGYVNDLLFINTSSVGAYPAFVRSRKYLQHHMHYYPASIIAGFRRLLKFRPVLVRLAGRHLRTPLVFIGVGERTIGFPAFGEVKKQGRKGLHLIAVDCTNGLEAFIFILKSLIFGVDPLQKQRRIENQLIDTSIDLYFSKRKSRVTVALDGELVLLRAPLRYRFAPAGIMVVSPLSLTSPHSLIGQDRFPKKPEYWAPSYPKYHQWWRIISTLFTFFFWHGNCFITL